MTITINGKPADVREVEFHFSETSQPQECKYQLVLDVEEILISTKHELELMNTGEMRRNVVHPVFAHIRSFVSQEFGRLAPRYWVSSVTRCERVDGGFILSGSCSER
jgi:hypothetical protein